MKVWRITTPGGPEVLELAERPVPEPGHGEVLVRVAAAGVNRADLLQCLGHYPPPPGVIEDVPGLEYAGVVERCGPGCTLRQSGARVMGITGGGAYGEYVVVHERETLTVPQRLGPTEAAAVPEAFLTAWRALFLVGELRPGDTAVIRPATSGVGMAAVQLAHAFGARCVGTSRSAERLRAVGELGMDAGHVPEDGALAECVGRQSDGVGAEVILDLLGGGHLAESLQSLRDEGRLVLVGLMAGAKDEIPLGTLLMRRLQVRAMTMRSLPLERRIGCARRFESEVLPLLADGRLKPVVDRTFPFAETPRALNLMTSAGHLGKLILVHGDGANW